MSGDKWLTIPRLHECRTLRESGQRGRTAANRKTVCIQCGARVTIAALTRHLLRCPVKEKV